MTDSIEYDLIIAGSGLAGLRAAVEGVKNGMDVAVVSKVHPVRSHSNAAQGGINAPLTDRGDDWAEKQSDVVKDVLEYVRASNDELRESSKYWYKKFKEAA